MDMLRAGNKVTIGVKNFLYPESGISMPIMFISLNITNTPALSF